MHLLTLMQLLMQLQRFCKCCKKKKKIYIYIRKKCIHCKEPIVHKKENRRYKNKLYSQNKFIKENRFLFSQ